MTKKGSSGAATVREIGALKVNEDRSIAIDLARLESPVATYDADVAEIQHLPGRVSVAFAKYEFGGVDKVRSRLEIRIAPEDFPRCMSQDAGFRERMKKYIATWPEHARGRMPPAGVAPSQKSHSDWASFTYMAHSGSYAAIDFYQISAAGIARMMQGQGFHDFKLTPVVRVHLSVFELDGLLDQALSVIQEIRKYVPITELTESTGERIDASGKAVGA